MDCGLNEFPPKGTDGNVTDMMKDNIRSTDGVEKEFVPLEMGVDVSVVEEVQSKINPKNEF